MSDVVKDLWDQGTNLLSTGWGKAFTVFSGPLVVGTLFTNAQLGDPLHLRTPRPSSIEARDSGVTLNTSATDSPIPVWYGFNYHVDSLVVYRDVGGPGNKFYYVIAVVGEGEIAGFDALYIDDVLSTDPKFAGLVTVEYHVGTDNQAASALLLADLPSKWTANDIGAGIAYAVIKCERNQNAFPGEPRFSFDIRGRKIKDTRDGVTRFSPNPALCIRDYWTNARYGRKVAESKIDDAKITAEANYFEGREAVPATAIGFNADPATDVLAFTADTPFDNGDGVQLSSSGALPAGTAPATTYYWIRIGARAGMLATTYANALTRTAIDLTSAGTGALTCTHIDQPRFTCNGALDPSANAFENLAALRSSARCWFFEAGGIYHLIADKQTAVSGFALSPDNLTGNWNIDLGDETQHFNRVEARFINPAANNQPDVATADSAADRGSPGPPPTGDGGRLMLGQLKLDFTTNAYMANRLAQIARRASRVGMVVTCTTTIQGFQAFCGDVLPLTHPDPGFVAKPFRLHRFDIASSDEYQIELHEYSDAVYVPDAQAPMTLPVRTTLPDPSFVDPPGVLAMVETIYETVEGPGVRTKATVSWIPSPNLFVQIGGFYQAEYRLVGAPDFKIAAVVGGNVTSVDILDLAQGRYDFQVKAINRVLFSSAYAMLLNKEIVGLGARPAAPTGLTLQASGGLAILKLDQHPEAAVRRGGRILVRHSESLSGATWEQSFSIGDANGYPGGSTIIVLPLKNGTYLVKAQNAAELQSASAASITTKQVTVLTFTSLTTLQEDTAFTGTHVNTVTIDGLLKLNSSGLWDDIVDFDSLASVDSIGGIASSGTYTFSAGSDLGTVKRVRVTGVIEGLTVNALDLIDSRTANIDDWLDFDGTAGGGSVDAWLEVRHTDDDPLGTPVWSEWKRLDASEFQARALDKPRLQLRSTDPAYNCHITKLRVKLEPVT